MPFHWVETLEEAQDLIVTHCAYNSVRGCYQIRPTWADQDIKAAIEAARKHFGLEGPVTRE